MRTPNRKENIDKIVIINKTCKSSDDWNLTGIKVKTAIMISDYEYTIWMQFTSNVFSREKYKYKK